MRFKTWIRRMVLGTALGAAAMASTGCDEEAIKASVEAARTTGDGDVDGRDFLIWQRGGSPAPQSASDLSDWQTNYGAGG